MKNYVTIKATIVTALLIILLISCVTIMYIKKDNPELESFLLAMSIGLSFCVLKCYFNIQMKLKLIEERAAKLREKNGHENHLTFETCPEYWTRKKIETSDGNEAVMCYNYFKNSNDEKILVGGEYNKHADTIEQSYRFLRNNDTRLKCSLVFQTFGYSFLQRCIILGIKYTHVFFIIYCEIFILG